MTFEEARAQFPVFERLRLPERRHERAARPRDRRGDDERSAPTSNRAGAGRAYFERALALRDDVGSKLAGLVGVPPENMVLATSTTNGCNIVLAGLGLGPEDEVVTTDGEHFGLIGALGASPARVRVAKVRELPPEQALEVLLAEVTPKTRLLALSHVCWMSGNRFPVDELKEATGLPLLIDGAQSAGAIPVDASRFDFYAFSCQKWLCGPDGTGGLAVADPDALGIAAPSYLSQESYEPDGEFSARPGGAALRPGVDAAAVAGRARGRPRRRRPSGVTSGRPRLPRAAVSCWPSASRS